MTARLLHYSDGSFQAVLDLSEGTVEIGRSKDCDFVLENPTVSRHHFRLTVDEDERVQLEDLGAENGTYVNGVREYTLVLGHKVTIQAGDEMFLFEPEPEVNTDSSPGLQEAPPPSSSPQTEPSTSSVAPVLLRRMQAEMRIRVQPHLIFRQEGESERVFPIASGTTEIGLGNVKISLGPSAKSQASVLAEVTLGKKRVEIRSKSFFSKIRVNGKAVSKVVLQAGDEIVLGSYTLIFHPGIDRRN